jgi:hypothetical protein
MRLLVITAINMTVIRLLQKKYDEAGTLLYNIHGIHNIIHFVNISVLFISLQS